ncbi:MAG: MFS transporter [Chloroflexi bacterium]|nr:MAG: MFS transporter [Chloroflexota bacterium]TME48528.1 MAG: MFS transporter [Chloroflexota bacterium]
MAPAWRRRPSARQPSRRYSGKSDRHVRSRHGTDAGWRPGHRLLIDAAASIPSRGRLSTASPLITFVVLGLPAGALGVAWPSMRSSFAAPLAGLGLILAGITVAYFLGSASFGPLSARLNGGLLLAAGCCLAGLGMLAFSVAFWWWVVPLLGILVGAGSGLIDASVNTQVSLSRGIRYMGWLHAAWAVGAALGPLLVVTSIAMTGSWRMAFAAAGIGFIGCGLLAGYQRVEWTTIPSNSASASQPAAPASYRSATALIAVMFLLGAGLEATTGDWSYTQLTLARGVASAAASAGASLFWAGLAGGRIALGTLGHRVAPSRLLDISVGACAVVALAFWLTPGAIANFVVLPLLGLAVSLIFPLLLSMTPGRVGAAMTGHTVGYGLAVGTLGGGAIPALAGLVLQGIGLGTLGPMLTGMAGALLLIHWVNRQP